MIAPGTPAQWGEARRLVEEYAVSLGIDLAFQDFQREIESMPEQYGPPGGAFLLAEHRGAFVGCGGLRRLSESVCEMKRLYVSPAGRGLGIGRTIALELIAKGRALGYATMRLDTLPAMHAARRMYAELGFREIEPYRYNPVEGTTFLELAL